MQNRTLSGWILAASLLAGTHSSGQAPRGDQLLDRLQQDLQSEQEANHGCIVWDDETTETYLQVLQARSVASLVPYTDDPIPALRSRIFMGLAQKGADTALLQALLKRHAGDTATFSNGTGCTVPAWSVQTSMQLTLAATRDGTLPPLSRYRERLEDHRAGRIVYVPGAHHNLIAKDSLLQSGGLRGSQAGFRIVSFQITTAHGASIPTGPGWTAAARRLLETLQTGDRIFFEEIRVALPDGSVRRVNPIFVQLRSPVLVQPGY